MSDRAEQLHATAGEQIAELIALVSTLDETTMRLPCPGREKLGDGTVAAAAQHTAENYQRIAGFVQTSHADHAHDATGAGENQYTAENVDLPALREQLTTTRASLTGIAALTDSQLQTIPPEGSFRFCDGRRTLEQVLEGLLKHQRHQLGALTGAIASPPTGVEA